MGGVISLYTDSYVKCGLLGIAGGNLMPKAPASWWDSEMQVGHLIQGWLDNGIYKERLDSWGEDSPKPVKVAVVDGFFMAMPRKMFDLVKWDESYGGFHCYDTDMSMQVWNVGYEVHITFDVFIRHKSPGGNLDLFEVAKQRFYEKWQNNLPVLRGKQIEQSEIEARTRIVELKNEIRKWRYDNNQVYNSLDYRLGHSIFRPLRFVKRILEKLRNQNFS